MKETRTEDEKAIALDALSLHYRGKPSPAVISILCDEDRELLLRMEKKIDKLLEKMK